MLDIKEGKTFYKRTENDSHFHVFQIGKQNETKPSKQYMLSWMACIS